MKIDSKKWYIFMVSGEYYYIVNIKALILNKQLLIEVFISKSPSRGSNDSQKL